MKTYFVKVSGACVSVVALIVKGSFVKVSGACVSVVTLLQTMMAK